MITEVQTQSAKPAAKRKRGFTLTEIAIVLGIIGLILGAIWAAASSVYANLKANQAQQGILAAAQAVRSLYATSATTNVVQGTVITSPGMFPVNWQSSTTGIVGNPWHVNPAVNYSFVIGNGQQFAIEIDDISDAGCATLIGFYSSAASSAQGGQVPGLVGSKADTTSTAGSGVPNTNLGKTTGTAALPSFYAAGPAGCKGGQLNDSVEVTFDMSIM